jgi:hypothetical protein
VALSILGFGVVSGLGLGSVGGGGGAGRGKA